MNTAIEKTARVIAALEHREYDRVPAGEFFWTKFVRRASEEFFEGEDFDPYRYFDLDMVVLTPNMDPHIQPFEVLEDDGEKITVKTGWDATIQRVSDYPMPRYLDFETQTVILVLNLTSK